MKKVQFERVANLYKETNLLTMSVVEYTLLLLKECLTAVETALENEDNTNNIERAQEVLFELMSVTNQKHVKGRNLFSFYVHVNQMLVEYRIQQDEAQLEKVARYVKEMMAAWEASKPKEKGYSYKRHDLTT